VDENRPDVDEDKQRNIGELLEREKERVYVVWNRLEETVDWMEGVRCEWCWHDPFVVRFVQLFVHERMVESTVDEVDQHVGEEQEAWELQYVVEWERGLVRSVVELGISSDVHQEQ
jgi:hypothetical protein